MATGPGLKLNWESGTVLAVPSDAGNTLEVGRSDCNSVNESSAPYVYRTVSTHINLDFPYTHCFALGLIRQDPETKTWVHPNIHL